MESVEDAQEVLDAYKGGNATFLGVTSNGHQVVKVTNVKGTNVNLGAGVQAQETNVFIIKGSSKPSVVPTNPNWKP